MKHVVRLVDDLLDVGRVTAGKIVLQRRPLDLAEVVAGVVNAWRVAGRFDHHDVSIEAAPVWVEGDETRLEQVVVNLLGNALKFTPANGAVTVRVGIDGREALLEVQDAGIGMAPDLIDHVFDLFAQGTQNADRPIGGLGIGLTLVRHLVERHGGTVTARSLGPGHGSLFSVRLPAIPDQVTHVVEAKDVPRAVVSRRILLIEDNDDSREMLRILLEDAGHVVLLAADGEEGVALAASAAPDIALIDIGLPRLDGYEVARRIRAAGGSRIALVALTGYGAAEDLPRPTRPVSTSTWSSRWTSRSSLWWSLAFESAVSLVQCRR